ncbi:MAG: hypothetical protein IJE60_04585 [Tyzzerella sp.]|nr:hypothetical protein [Tyzzerella sp.]
MENTNEVLENIVKQSIRNVICIDDGFLEPYSEPEGDALKFLFSKEMFDGISNTCQCSVTMVQYKGDETERLIEEKLNDKDLLILDWELTTTGQIKKPIEVIDCALDKNIPYICIYTNSKDLKEISAYIEKYYSGYDMQTAENAADIWEREGLLKEEFLDNVKACFEDKAKIPTLIKKVQELCPEIDTVSCNYRKIENWIPVYLKWENCLLPEQLKYIAKRVDGKDTVLNIDGKMVFVFSKKNSDADDDKAISPEQIVPAIAESMVLKPNSIMDCVWLYYANCYCKAVYKRPQFFKDIAYEGFAYHVGKMFESEDQALESFFKEIFNEELMDILNSQDISIPTGIVDKILEDNKNSSTVTCHRDLVKLNERLTINRRYSECEHKIAFGDVFYCTDAESGLCEYWLCITAKCDCVKPEEKIRNNYIFIGGRYVGDSVALTKAETDYYSFINSLEQNRENPICIQWCGKINSIYIKQNVVTRGKEIVGNLKSVDKHFVYLGNVKENYAQRMANMAFANGNRVGVSLAKL